MGKWYEILFYDWDGAYHLVSRIQSGTGDVGLKDKLADSIRRVRRMFNISEDVLDSKIYESLYIMQIDKLISARDILNPQRRLYP